MTVQIPALVLQRFVAVSRVELVLFFNQHNDLARIPYQLPTLGVQRPELP
jgi:hypothetical protein